jgi:hypothetical protein
MTSSPFFGIHDDERVLHVITIPRLLMGAYWCGLIGAVAALSFLFREIAQEQPLELRGDIRRIGQVVLALCSGIGGVWGWRLQSCSRTYITDRRVVRFRPLFPFFESRRVLFWTEAAKTKAWSANLLLRIFGIGTIRVVPLASEEHDLRITSALQYEEIANFVDHLIYVTKRQPKRVPYLAPFDVNAEPYQVEVLDPEYLEEEELYTMQPTRYRSRPIQRQTQLKRRRQRELPWME